ncbi:MAG: DUF4129 domain-containing protein, partial [Thermoanaerobaculia bacterium]|nr:DUF4129 domain-containing protein [Thermoanaerobaculia bacterium]
AIVVFHMARIRRRSMFDQLSEHLERMGYPVERSSTAGEVLEFLRRTDPRVAMIVAPVVRYHELERFSGRDPDDELRQAARAALKKLAER